MQRQDDVNKKKNRLDLFKGLVISADMPVGFSSNNKKMTVCYLLSRQQQTDRVSD